MELASVLIPLKLYEISEHLAFKYLQLIRFSTRFHQTIHRFINIRQQIQDVTNLINLLIFVMFVLIIIKVLKDFAIHVSKVEFGPIVMFQHFLTAQVGGRPQIVIELVHENVTLEKFRDHDASVDEFDEVVFKQVRENVGVLVLDDVLDDQGGCSDLIGV